MIDITDYPELLPALERARSRTLRVTDFDDDYNTVAEIAANIQTLGNAAPKTTPTLLCELTVVSQQLIAWGYTDPVTGEVRRPKFIALHKGTAAEAVASPQAAGFFDGSLYFRLTDRDGSELPTAAERDTGGLRKAGAYEPNNATAAAFIERDVAKIDETLPLTPVFAEEGDRLQLFMLTKVGPGVAADDVYFELPATLITV